MANQRRWVLITKAVGAGSLLRIFLLVHDQEVPADTGFVMCGWCWIFYLCLRIGISNSRCKNLLNRTTTYWMQSCTSGNAHPQTEQTTNTFPSQNTEYLPFKLRNRRESVVASIEEARRGVTFLSRQEIHMYACRLLEQAVWLVLSWHN